MTTTYGIENPGPGLGQAQTYGGVKLVNKIPTLPLLKAYRCYFSSVQNKWFPSNILVLHTLFA
jgi:hypothetical protein